MKVKIMCDESYDALQQEFDLFAETVRIIEVKVFELQDIRQERCGFVTYHIFYEDHGKIKKRLMKKATK